MAFAWTSKGTVAATLAAQIGLDATSRGDGYEDYVIYGQNIQTCAVLAILFHTPISTFLVGLLGKVFLSKDEEVHPTKKQD